MNIFHMLTCMRSCDYLQRSSALAYAMAYHSPLRALRTRRWACTPAVGGGMVSSCGRVQSKYGVITWGSTTADGYRVTGVGGSKKYVHRLVARAFIGKPQSLHQSEVNHIDGDRSNNTASNLEYVTRAQSIQHSYAINLSRKTNSEAVSIPILARLQGTASWEHFQSIKGAARALKLDPRSVWGCCRGWCRSASGYEFMHAAPSEPALLPGEGWRAVLHPADGHQLSSWEVSSLGRVKSSRGIISRGSRTTAGYLRAGIRHLGSFHSVLVHRLVARAFLGPPPDWARYDVHHIDGVKSNNRVDNLEYTTRSNNIVQSYRSNLMRRSNAPARSKPVWAYSQESGDWYWFESMCQAARTLGVSSGSISKCCRGICRIASGLEFRIDEPKEPKLLSGDEWRHLPHDI